MEHSVNDSVVYLNPPEACPAQGLYSHAARVTGPLLFVAGQLAVDAEGRVAGEGSFDAQFQQVFRNLGGVLGGLGASYNDVVRFTTYLVRPADIERFMELRAELFPKLFRGPLFPPNTLLVVKRLVKEEFWLEIEAIVRDREL